MKQSLKLFFCILMSGFLISGCAKSSTISETTNELKTLQETQASQDSSLRSDSSSIDTSDMFTERDLQTTYDTQGSAHIQFNGETAQCSSDAVKIEQSTVTITDGGTYILSGSLNNGMLIVNADENDKIQLVFDNVNINNDTCAALYILEAEKVFITLTDNSQNTLSNGGTFSSIDDNNIDGTLFSKQDLTINGNGTLNILSPSGHGIVCKDDLVFTGGTYSISSSSHGLDVNDSVRVMSAQLQIEAGKDGIHVENAEDASKGYYYVHSGDFNINAQGDGISSSSYALIDYGTFNIITGGGSINAQKQTSDNWGAFPGGMEGGMMGRPGGMGERPIPENQTMTSDETSDETSTSIKGIKSSTNLWINNGNFTVDSADDAFHSNGSVTVNNGTFRIASGDDAFHADETLNMNNGNIIIDTSYEGLEGLDIVISGGDITVTSDDDGINAAGGTDSSGTQGFRGGDNFGNRGGMGGPGGMMSAGNGSILISGGNIYINASGDGIDANGSLEITGGNTILSGPVIGDTAVLDYDTTATISGGTFIGTGGSMMAQTFSNSTQGVMAISVGNMSANTPLSLVDSAGNVIMSYTTDREFSIFIMSCPELISGETYTVNVGDASQDFSAQ